MLPRAVTLRFTNVPRIASPRFAPATARLGFTCHQRRTVASSVSNRPASQSFEHAKKNIQEELGGSASILARVIASASTNSLADMPAEITFLGLTTDIANRVPKPAMILGLAGALPYVATAGMTVYLAHQASLAATGLSTADATAAMAVLQQALHIQTTYGAVMLSFLGALHWGMEFSELGGRKGYSRLLLGAAPVLYAWPTLALDPIYALGAQWIGFSALWFADAQASRAGWTPGWYSQYRFYLTLLVGSCIVGSLAGATYFGPVPGHDQTSRELAELRAKRYQRYREEGPALVLENVPVWLENAGELGDSYIVVKKNEPTGKDE